jgi:hypothetical protein
MNLLEGGNVFKDADGQPLTQRINQTDVKTTLAWLDEMLPGLDLQNNTLGSTGIKDTSGDLDIAVDSTEVSKEQLITQLTQWAVSQKQNPRDWIRKTGTAVHFKTPINGRPDSGYVQTDFMFLQNVPWSKFVLGAMPADSRYKGRERNVLMNSIAKSMGYKLNQIAGIADRTTNKIITDDPDAVAKMLLNRSATREDLASVESILQALSKDPKRDAKLADFRAHMEREGLPFLEDTMESTALYTEYNEVNFLARLRDRIVNQGMQPIMEADAPVIHEAEVAGVGGRAKGIEHLEDLVFRHGSRGVEQALNIVAHAAEAPSTTTVKWDGKPAVVFGRKPATGEFVLTDGSGFEAKGYDGLATSPDMMAKIQNQRSGDRTELTQLYATLFPVLESAIPANFRGYVKGDLLYMATPQLEAGNYVFKPNTVQYRIPAKSSLGQRIGASTIGIAMHSMYADVGDARQPLSRVKFNEVPGLLLIEPIGGKEIVPDPALVKEIKSVLRSKGQAIDILFNPAELRAQQITDLAKLCVDYINARIPTGNFDNLLAGFGEWLQARVTPRKFANIIEYLKSPASNTEGLAAAFTLFILLHNLKLDILQQLDIKDPGHEGWVMATPAGYAKAVNRFDFTARNRAQNNP